MPTDPAKTRHGSGRTTRWLPTILVAATAVVAPTGCDDPVPPPPEAASIKLIPSAVTFTATGDTAGIRAVVMDEDGDTLTDHPVDWATSDELVATVSPSGVVRAIGPGTARITATAGSVSAEAIATVIDVERRALEALYNAAGGEGWAESEGWLTDDPVSEWFGVETDSDGRVVAIDLTQNGLLGSLPKEIGDLAHLRRLLLSYNYLSAPIPPEIGDLAELRELDLRYCVLIGVIPREIGNLTELRRLDLAFSLLTGPIPREIGDLAELRELDLSYAHLTGSIPVEIGDLAELRELRLQYNEFTGGIPAELGRLENLTGLYAHGNNLSGEIPGDLGDLSQLRNLWLGGNDLTGSFPEWLTRMPELRELMLMASAHTGALPESIGDMGGLERLLLANTRFSGLVPTSITRLQRLEELMLGGTELCAPDDEGFRAWLRSVPKKRVSACVGPDRSAAYLVQAVQSLDYAAPLVAGEPALLRVFVVAPAAEGEAIPPVRATLYLDGEVEEVVEIEPGSPLIGKERDEGSMDASANAVVPGSAIRPGLEMVVEIDPDTTMDLELGVMQRIPEKGRMSVEVHQIPDLEFTLIPFLWESNPDSTILEITEDLSTDDELLWPINTLLPVADMDLVIHDPVVSTSNDAISLIEETIAIRAAENGTGYFMGTMSQVDGGAVGVAVLSGWSSFSIPDSSIMAHELGHNMSLNHAPCGGASLPDPLFPKPDGSIGSWGYDFASGELVDPSVKDVMSYCDPKWINEYHFGNSVHHRLYEEVEERRQAASVRSLLIWGGTDSEGAPHLRPAFVIDAEPFLPRSGGPYRLTGMTGQGGELFTLDFDMPVVADAEGRGSFAFTLPVQPAWADDLARIGLAGPGGSVTLDRDATRPTAIIRDPRTGKVRGILADLPRGAAPDDILARGGFEPDLELFLSRGIPDAAAWRR